MQLSEPFLDTDECWRDGARIGHSGVKLHTEAIIDLQLFYRTILNDQARGHPRIHLPRVWTIGGVILLLDEYLNSAPKRLELAQTLPTS
jgi:hypothetical protein